MNEKNKLCNEKAQISGLTILWWHATQTHTLMNGARIHINFKTTSRK